ncbi:phosphatidylinositol 4-phosphate 5-kinase 10 [Cocos nucifera]|uniref:1-phosphatidylinositol-4-phosphate 5-kinase n=1 Tax=Cocos nucifera TaxID=13894 RepID=A0A8K0HXQ4_COCNU|nr:phosphatidylinositol 4-phosphate 5-kinase 10 [Cocos nucifera]
MLVRAGIIGMPKGLELVQLSKFPLANARVAKIRMRSWSKLRCKNTRCYFCKNKKEYVVGSYEYFFLAGILALIEHHILNLDFMVYWKTQLLQLLADCSPDSRGTPIEYEWTDYCPEVFRKLQGFENIDTGHYLVSVRDPETIKQLFLKKKNGPRHFSSYDNKFIFKTLSKPEMKVILDMLPNYYHHVNKYRNTLLVKFFGLHAVKPSNGQKVCFVVTENILQSDVIIHKTLSLKCSFQCRFISKTGVEEDLHFAFHLHTPTRSRLLAQIQHDCKFLEDEGIMDYTLLLGMHVCPAPFDSVIKDRNTSAHAAGSDGSKGSPSDSPKLSQSDEDVDSATAAESESSCPIESDVKFGVKMPARVVNTRRKETWSAATVRAAGNEENNKVFLYFGIVDIIQGCGMLKRVENALKSLQYDPQSTSAINPKAYSARFEELVCSIFPEKYY